MAEKKICSVDECGRETWKNDERCIFHSKDRKGKKHEFMYEFYEFLDKREKNFVGFAFPEGTDLREADLRDADLFGADLSGADLSGANLSGANLENASFEKANVADVKYDRSTKFKGIDVTQAKANPQFVRFAKDQEYLEAMRSTKWGKFKYYIWLVFADCGRSIWLWALWAMLFAFIFGVVYSSIGPSGFKPKPEGYTCFSFFYYSIVTFTTLGFGDITPITCCTEILVTIEVILGYIMLGGLISILANMLARRS
ncbi:MAG: pentapeptide repeat-containing protein [Candidatus Aminicenantes bacterium]|nr:pentapeptide repeat-containing protein [Candidatus Aminicenantes bacterium]